MPLYNPVTPASIAAAPLNSPALTGTPTAPTAAPGDTSTQVATDAFVAAAVAIQPTGVAATDTAAIQAAISSSGVALLGAGTFAINATLVPNSGANVQTMVIGRGWNTILQADTTAVSPVFGINYPTDTTSRRVILKDLWIQNSGASAAGTAIDMNYWQFSVISNVKISGGAHHPNVGILAGISGTAVTTHYNRVSDCSVQVDGTNAIGLNVIGASIGAESNLFENIRVLISGTDSTQTGIVVATRPVFLVKPDIENFAGIGIDIQAGGDGCTILDAYLENASAGCTGTAYRFASGVVSPVIIGGTNLATTSGAIEVTDNGAIAPKIFGGRWTGQVAHDKVSLQQAGAAGGILAVKNTTSAPSAPNIQWVAAASTDSQMGTQAAGDAQYRMLCDASGKHSWGSGAATQDTNLYRGSAGVLQTDGSLDVVTHALGQVQPRDHGLAAWTYDPALVSTGFQPATGTQYLCGLYVSRAVTVSSIYWEVQTAAGAATASQNYAGLVNSSGTLLQSTSATALDTVITSTGVKTTAITSQALTPGFYWVVFLFNYTGTALKLAGMGNLTPGLPNVGLVASTYRYATCGATQTSLGNFPVTTGSNSPSSATFWAAVS